MIRISFDQARAITIQPAILYYSRTAKQILVEGTLDGINEAKCTQCRYIEVVFIEKMFPTVAERNSISS